MLAGLAGELEVVLGKLHRGLDGVAAAGGEEDAVEIAGGVGGEALGELDGLRVGEGPQRHEGQLHGLVVHRLRDLLATVSDLDGEETGEAVDVALALIVEDVVAFAAGDDRCLSAVEQGLVRSHMHPHVVAHGFLIRSAGSGDILCHRVPQLYFCFSSERYMKSSVSTTASIDRSSLLTK